jgi:hypothetical protein
VALDGAPLGGGGLPFALEEEGAALFDLFDLARLQDAYEARPVDGVEFFEGFSRE